MLSNTHTLESDTQNDSNLSICQVLVFHVSIGSCTHINQIYILEEAT